MKKIIIASAVLAFALAGCASQAAQPAPQQKPQVCPHHHMHGAMGEKASEHKHKDGAAHSHHKHSGDGAHAHTHAKAHAHEHMGKQMAKQMHKSCGCKGDKSVDEYISSQNALSASESAKIVSEFKGVIKSVEVSAYAKGIEAQIDGLKAVSLAEFKKIGQFAAETIRKNREISGKVHIYFSHAGKELFHSMF